MKQIALISSKIQDTTILELMNRDAALWVCDDADLDEEQLSLLAKLIVLPWKLVLCEKSDSNLILEVEKFGSANDELSSLRGFVHIISANPNVRQLPERSLPVYLLNGCDGSNNIDESSKLKGIAATRRRLNMIERLESTSPKQLVVVGKDVTDAANDLSELWGEEFRSLITFVIPESVKSELITDIFKPVADMSSIGLVYSNFKIFAEYITNRCVELLPDSKLSILVQGPKSKTLEVNIKTAELIEQPLLEKFELIKSKDLFNVIPDSLSEKDINSFFDKTEHSWRAYSAGLPWIPDHSIINKLLKSLRKVNREGSEENRILYIVSEPGAGGTTIAKTLAFEAAKNGFPTLIAKPQIFEPNATEVASFLYRSLNLINENFLEREEFKDIQRIEIPWLIVFDRDQWDGQEQAIGNFLAELKRSGRSVIILKVLGQVVPPDFYNIPKSIELCSLTHSLERDQMMDLGKHLNKYLKHLNKSKSEYVWLQFWETHKPDIDTTIAAFWIILEFWLKGLVNIGESIPAWMVNQLKEQSITDEERLLILEIAALATERRSIPEQLLPLPKIQKLPLSYLLEKIRSEIPAFALIQQKTSVGRSWSVAHDILGRYLINGVFYDKPLLKQLKLDEFQNPVELRLFFIAQLTQRAKIGETIYSDFAAQFALKTLKLDDRYGNAEFFYYWRKIITILDNFPNTVKETNRTFNHHVAISRRRVAKLEQFDASVEEKREQLLTSINQIKFSLDHIKESESDESNLNLYNSLALAYQDLSALELEQNGISDYVKELRKKASDATLNALKENPNSSFVLETAAKDLLQKCKFDSEDVINTASQALSYIFQATALENSQARQHQLNNLANSALSLLKGRDANEKIENMISQGNPMGYLAKAWINLTNDQDRLEAITISQFSHEGMTFALETLKDAPRHWLLIRIEYDLLVALEPDNYQGQLHLLEELESINSYRMALQLELEKLLLFYMVGRYSEANSAFNGLRKKIKQQNIIVTVPDRLRWLLEPKKNKKLLCNAKVMDSHDGYRSWAQVRELQNATVPFIPQDFGGQRMGSLQRFKCYITFGAMGPFIKAPL